MSQREFQEKEGGNKGMWVATNESAERSIQEVAENDRGQEGQSGNTRTPQDDTTTSETTKDTLAENTDVHVGDSTYLTERVRGVEQNEERAKWSHEDQSASTEEINAEIRHAAVLNRGLDRRPSAKGEEGRAEGAATYRTCVADGRGEDRKDQV